MDTRIYNFLLETKKRKGAGFIPLIDPDNQSSAKATKTAQMCEKEGADAILVGGSIMLEDNFADVINEMKKVVNIPLIIFPGIFNLGEPCADAILFMSLISSRNPQLLIGEQVKAAPMIKKAKIETIPTGYMIIESGCLTSVAYMSSSLPIPRDKVDIAVAHALAAQYLGMKLLFMDAGSGARFSVPNEMIAKVKSSIEIPIMIGGGVRSPDEAREKVEAGADFVVIGSAIEDDDDKDRIHAFADAIHRL
jgi:putative glycerol-1-phosphate prenyltransferase